MLRIYARCLTEMLTNREGAGPADFEALDIDPELKCILYECYRAKDSIEVKEQERYDQEIARYLQRESDGNDEETKRMEFKEQVKKDKENAEQQEAAQIQPRSIRRKPELPKANARNFDEENQRMGVTHELDLLMGEGQDMQDLARSKMERGLIEYTSGNTAALQKIDKKVKDSEEKGKKEKQERYLTIQGLLGHPYFMSINEADIAVIIDEFERFSQNY